MTTLRGLVGASHPEPVAAVTGVVILLCAFNGRGWTTMWAGAAILSGQLFIGWMNDFLDAPRDRVQARLDKPVVRGQVSAPAVKRALILAGSLCIPLSLANGLAAGVVHLLAVLSAALYNLGLKRTVMSWLPYAVSFGLIPAFVTLGMPAGPHPPPVWATAAAALLGVGGHLTQSLTDIEHDRSLGLTSLPAQLGVDRSIGLAALLIGGAAGVIFAGARSSPFSIAALAAALALDVCVISAGLLGRRRLAFRLTLAAAGSLVLLLISTGRGLQNT